MCWRASVAGYFSAAPTTQNNRVSHWRLKSARAYTDADIRLLASMDERHGQPSGGVLKKLCERAYQQFGQEQYQRLSQISVSHLYNLRASTTYQRQRCTLTKTQPTKAPVGLRRKPFPNQQPGYIRIDSVHQRDQDKRKGVYHINAVDEVTQFQVIATLARINENHMLPAPKQLLHDFLFLFKIKGLHAGNGHLSLYQLPSTLLLSDNYHRQQR